MGGRPTFVGFRDLASLSNTLERLFRVLPSVSFDTVELPLDQCAGRHTVEDVRAPFDLPPFDRATVDGYALDVAKSFGASPTDPVTFKVVGEAAIGVNPRSMPPISGYSAMAIATGAPVPPGANAVAMLETCIIEGDTVLVSRQVHPTQNVSRRGEDYVAGETIVAKNWTLRPWHLAALASIGMGRVPVTLRLIVGILSTGSELVEPDQTPSAGQVVNSSKPMLKCLAREDGCDVVDLGTLPDNVGIIQERLRDGLSRCDALVTTGGSSVGERDFVPSAVANLEGSSLVAHGIGIRPGRPTGVGTVHGKPVFILSGFPVAALAAYDSIVRPTLYHWQKLPLPPVPMVRGKLTRRVSNQAGLRTYLRVRVSNTPAGRSIEPLMMTGSGLLSTLTKANGLLVLDESMEGFEQGEEVEVRLIDSIA